ncbi:Bacterial transferase hexapeptide (six repeats) [Carpediemonas membranifera]|uniref:Bacterial transferase hexapeptide (Six repeats) n=1 Tax=Carpediemonas membranifera TaxID=201153 RepID=A0A8J6AWD3_9EUKA|nr:Bacterial transferase hexapeptide (six repeats) [Carpediemonas membranifera]|eukprot:KAG9395833.1 Bacterial transferase hexapeptide (six repeats) [Carpediemonas membranifera]
MRSRSGDSVTAIILADEFGDLMSPVSDFLPPILFPVANIPTIEYMLEYLYMHGITQVYIAASRSFAALKEYLKHSRFAMARNHPLRVNYAQVGKKDTNISSLLKEVHSKLRTNRDDDSLYVLMTAPCIPSFDLHALIQRHRQRADDLKADHRSHGIEGSDLAMTVVAHRAGPHNPVASPANPTTVMTDGRGFIQQIPDREDVTPISVRALKSGPLTVHANLGVSDIVLFKHSIFGSIGESYDTAQVFMDIVKAILGQYETLQAEIALDIAPGICAPISSFGNAASATWAILRRWFPQFLPETLVQTDKANRTTFTHSSGIYTEVPLGDRCTHRPTHVTRSAARPCVMVGADGFVHTDAVLRRACVGRSCSISAGVELTGTIVMSNVVVRDGAVVEDSVIMADATIGRNAQIGPDVVIGPNVIVPDGAVLDGPAIYMTQGQESTVSGSDSDSDSDSASAGMVERRGIGSRHSKARKLRESTWESMSTLPGSPSGVTNLFIDSMRSSRRMTPEPTSGTITATPGTPVRLFGDLLGHSDSEESLRNQSSMDSVRADIRGFEISEEEPRDLDSLESSPRISIMTESQEESEESETESLKSSSSSLMDTDFTRLDPANPDYGLILPGPGNEPGWVDFVDVVPEEEAGFQLIEDRVTQLREAVVNAVRAGLESSNTPDDIATSVNGIACAYRTADDMMSCPTTAALLMGMLSHAIAQNADEDGTVEDVTMPEVLQTFGPIASAWRACDSMARFFELADGSDDALHEAETELLYQMYEMFTEPTSVVSELSKDTADEVVENIFGFITAPISGPLVREETFDEWLEEGLDDEDPDDHAFKMILLGDQDSGDEYDDEYDSEEESD